MQFTEQRMADAKAMCERNWGHFQDTPGELLFARANVLQMFAGPCFLNATKQPCFFLPAKELPADGRLNLLPSELARKLLETGKRGMVPLRATTNVESGPSRALARCMEYDKTKNARQRTHSMADYYGIDRGEGVQLVASYGTQPRTTEAFLSQAVATGGFVATRAAQNSALKQMIPDLELMPYWVWQILRIYQPGESVQHRDGKATVATEPVYEAQIFVAASPETVQGKLQACWEIQAGGAFLRTAEEKQKRQVNKFWGKKRKTTAADKQARFKLPLTAFLRPANVVGGGFHLTPARQLPAYVRLYLNGEFDVQA